jgi:hypothetical protein
MDEFKRQVSLFSVCLHWHESWQVNQQLKKIRTEKEKSFWPMCDLAAMQEVDAEVSEALPS